MSSFEYTITFPLKHGALETDFRNCSYVLSISLEKAFLLLTHFVLSLNLIAFCSPLSDLFLNIQWVFLTKKICPHMHHFLLIQLYIQFLY